MSFLGWMKLFLEVLKVAGLISKANLYNLSSRTLHQQFESYKQEVRRIGVETRHQPTQQKDDAPTCGICRKTKFADGCGHLCSYCQTKFCARCGGRVSLRSNNVRLLNSGILLFFLFSSFLTYFIPAADNIKLLLPAFVLCLYALSSCFLARFEQPKCVKWMALPLKQTMNGSELMPLCKLKQEITLFGVLCCNDTVFVTVSMRAFVSLFSSHISRTGKNKKGASVTWYLFSILPPRKSDTVCPFFVADYFRHNYYQKKEISAYNLPLFKVIKDHIEPVIQIIIFF